jgi:hypothetical protein
VVNLLAMSGFLPLAGGAWIVPALPGMAVNMAAAPETMQAALMDHYAWPILPWVFMSTAAGALWLHGRSRRFAVFWVVLLLAATAIDNPAVRRLHETRLNPDAGQVLRQLRGLQGTVVLAQPNLIPHLPRTANLLAVGGTLKPGAEPDLVLLTEVGNLWPLRPEEVVALIEAYGRDERYQRVTTGPLHAFKRR